MSGYLLKYQKIQTVNMVSLHVPPFLFSTQLGNAVQAREHWTRSQKTLALGPTPPNKEECGEDKRKKANEAGWNRKNHMPS